MIVNRKYLFGTVLVTLAVVAVVFAMLQRNADRVAPSSLTPPVGFSSRSETKDNEIASIDNKDDEQLVRGIEDRDWKPTPHFDPADLYRRYSESAEAGDVVAAFVLVSALQECRNVVGNEDEFEAQVLDGDFSESVVNSHRKRIETCKPLFGQVGNVRAEYDRWYSVIRESGHPLFLVKQRNLPYEEVRALVSAVVSQEFPERHLYFDAYLAASRLYGEFPEFGVDEPRYFAWQLLACDVSIHCNADELQSKITNEFSSIQSILIVEMRDELQDAVNRQATDELHLN